MSTKVETCDKVHQTARRNGKGMSHGDSDELMMVIQSISAVRMNR